jgi:hypothetical protein
VEALKAIYEEDFRIVNDREKSLRVTIRSDDHSLSLDLLVRTSLKGRKGRELEGRGGRRREKSRLSPGLCKAIIGVRAYFYVLCFPSQIIYPDDYPMTSPPIYEIK